MTYQDNSSTIDPDIIKIFRVESMEHIESLDSLLLSLEETPQDLEIVNSIFRAIHTIKGSASVLGFTGISEITHKLENLLNDLRKGRREVKSEIIDILLQGTSILTQLINNLGSPLSEETRKLTTDFIEVLDNILKLENSKKEKEEAIEVIKNEENTTIDLTEDIFCESATSLMDSMKQNYERLSKGETSPDIINSINDSINNLYKSANYLGYTDISACSKSLVDIIELIQNGILNLDPDVIDVINDHISKLEKLLSSRLKNFSSYKNEEIKQEKSEPEDIEKKSQEDKLIQTPSVPAISKNKMMRIEQEKLDFLMNLAGELIITKNFFLHLTKKFDITFSNNEIVKKIKSGVSQLNKISDTLQNVVMKMRMVSIKTVLQRFPRMVRDLAKKCNKKVFFKIIGEETEIDKGIGEDLVDPLIHLIRNAVDHGIETPEKRIAAGKPVQGQIILRASHEGNSVIIEIIDDGAGIDIDKIKQKIIENGLASAEALENMSDEEITNFIFTPGFSTSQEVTDISGRGVGMDVVRNNISKLKGNIKISSKKGYGTNFRIELPLTLAIIEVLMIRSNGQDFAIPIEVVTESLKIPAKEIKHIRGKKTISLRGNVIGLVTLNEILSMNSEDSIYDQEVANIVVISVRNKKIGIIIDKLLERTEIVVKSLDDFLACLPGLTGASIMGDGRITLILDPIELVNLATTD